MPWPTHLTMSVKIIVRIDGEYDHTAKSWSGDWTDITENTLNHTPLPFKYKLGNDVEEDAPCFICHGTSSEGFLFCDMCDEGYHLACDLDPSSSAGRPGTATPDMMLPAKNETWHCSSCQQIQAAYTTKWRGWRNPAASTSSASSSSSASASVSSSSSSSAAASSSSAATSSSFPAGAAGAAGAVEVVVPLWRRLPPSRKWGGNFRMLASVLNHGGPKKAKEGKTIPFKEVFRLQFDYQRR